MSAIINDPASVPNERATAFQAPSDVAGSVARRRDTKLNTTLSRLSRTKQNKNLDRSSVMLTPEDPERWPMERILWAVGFLFFPCWIVGALWNPSGLSDTFAGMYRWRSQVMAMIVCYVIAGVIAVESIYKGK